MNQKYYRIKVEASEPATTVMNVQVFNHALEAWEVAEFYNNLIIAGWDARPIKFPWYTRTWKYIKRVLIW